MSTDDTLQIQTDPSVQSQIYKLQREVEDLKKQVRTDYLTGLFNRRHLDYTLDQEIERTHRTNNPTTIILLDVDNFKKFNDTYGHVVGDQALKHIARLITQTIRKIDIACRYGGEEFAIILPSTEVEEGNHVAERIRAKIENEVFIYRGDSYRLTASLGVDSLVYNDNETYIQLIERCDTLMYRAKNSGKNCVISRNTVPA